MSKSSKSESMSGSFSWVSFRASMTDATSIWFTSASDGSYSSSESAVKTSLSSVASHAQTRVARPLSNKTQMRTAQDIAHDFEFFFEQHLHPFAYVWLQKWVWSYLAILKIGSNGEIVCLEQTVMTRVAGDIQSSSRQNSGGRRLVLKPLGIHGFLN